jgi:hypothetical protein
MIKIVYYYYSNAISKGSFANFIYYSLNSYKFCLFLFFKVKLIESMSDWKLL